MTTMDKTKAKRMKQGSAEWHAERSKGIGGSDMAAVMGLKKILLKIGRRGNDL